MAIIYLDNDLPLGLVRLLGEEGHDVLHARFEGMRTAPDGHQLLFAVQHGAVMVTHNREDFKIVHDAWRRWSIEWGVSATHYGILVALQGQSTRFLAIAIEQQLPRTAANELYVQDTRHLWRHHPFRP